MRFYHKVDKAWFAARQSHLTASDVRKIIPLTATGRRRSVTDDMYMDVLAPKLANIDDSQLESTGAAARGHLLERYAVEEFNLLDTYPMLKHWDDCLIARDDRYALPLAFSPDALDVSQLAEDGVVVKAGDLVRNPTVVGEVKSYGPERYLKTVLRKPDEVEERWQIATAMMVCPTIETGYLILYNPDIGPHGIHVKAYNRETLAEEMRMIYDAVILFNEWFDDTMDRIDAMANELAISREKVYSEIACQPGCEM